MMQFQTNQILKVGLQNAGNIACGRPVEGHHLLAGDPVGLELSPLRLEGVLQGLVVDDVDALDFQVDSRIWTKVLKSIKDSKVVGFLLFKTTS